MNALTSLIPAWEDGELKPLEKLAVHQRGLRHKAISVFINDGDKTLLQRRALSKYHTPGLWSNACCTHPHWDEPAQDCAARRLMEELGISAVGLQFERHVEYRADVGNGLIEHEEVDLFSLAGSEGMAMAANPDEVMDTRWVRYADLAAEIARSPEAFTPWLRIYLEQEFSAKS